MSAKGLESDKIKGEKEALLAKLKPEDKSAFFYEATNK
jgi:hypothetical protein